MAEIFLPKAKLTISTTSKFDRVAVADETSRVLHDPAILNEYKTDPVERLRKMGIEISGKVDSVTPEELKAELAFVTRKDQLTSKQMQQADVVMVVATVVTVAY